MPGRIHIYLIFFHPDFTVGFGVKSSPKGAVLTTSKGKPLSEMSLNRICLSACGLYRRWGISPRPEDYQIIFIS